MNCFINAFEVRKKDILTLLSVVLCFSFQAQQDVQNESATSSVIWQYTLPDKEEGGPMDVSVQISYHFVRYGQGDGLPDKVNIVYDITSVSYHATFGTLRYKYKGRIFKQNELNAADGRAGEGFEEIQINGISINMSVNGGLTEHTFNMDSNFSGVTDITEIPKNSNLNSLTLDLVLSRATEIYFSNPWALHTRIDRLEKTELDRAEYKKIITRADNAFNLNNLVDAKSSYEDALSYLPEDPYAKGQIEKIERKIAEKEKAEADAQKKKEEEEEAKQEAQKKKEEEEKARQETTQKTNSNSESANSFENQNSGSSGYTNSSNSNDGQKTTSNTASTSASNKQISSNSDNTNAPAVTGRVNGETVKVFKSDGVYYMVHNDGTITKTTQNAYSAVATDSQNRAAAQKANTERFQEEERQRLAREEAERLAREEKQRKETEAFNAKVDHTVQSFYTLQNLSDERNDILSNSRLSGNYSSVQELENDYNSKYSEVTNSLSDLHEQEQEYLSNNLNYYSTQAPAEDQVVGIVVTGIGMIANEIQNNRETQRAQEDLRQQRAAQLAEIERKRIEKRQGLRMELLSMFPEGGIPLSQHKVIVEQAYFFIYAIDEATLNENRPVIQLTNVFPIARYSDGTWPFRSSIQNELTKLPLVGKTTFVGFYTTKQMADDMRNSFVRLCGKSEMDIQEIYFKGKPKVVTTQSSGGGGKQENTKSNTEDFWGKSVPGTGVVNGKPIPSDTVPKDNTKTTDDFWGKSVKGSANQPTKTNTPTTTNQEKKSSDDFWGTPIKKN